MAVNINELQKAMDTLGISDIHITKEQAKKIYKKLLIKWHPDSCLNGDESYYNEISSKINAAYEIIEKAYEEGLMGPNAKDVNESAYSYNSNPGSNHTGSYSSKQSEYKSQNNDNTHTGNRSQTNTASSAKNQYNSSEYYDSPNGFDIVYFRKRWLNIIFLTICTLYVINAIIKSSETDIYIEKSVLNLITMLAIYYSVYWFCKCFAADIGFFVSGILAWVIYKATTFMPMYIYNKFGADLEWIAMLLFIVVFFVAEYFIHIKKILLTFDKKIKVGKLTKFFSCLMLLEYSIMFVFGVYSVILVHKFITIRNTIIMPWY